ncbi:MAG: hypothetical protein ACOCSE_02455 [Chitinivibrionales bacterium]
MDRLLSMTLLILLISWIESSGQEAPEPDTSGNADSSITQFEADSLKEAAESDSGAEIGSYKVVKRKKDYNKLLRGAIAMMLFIAIVMGTEQNWNP